MAYLAQIQDTKITCIAQELYKNQYSNIDFMVVIPDEIAILYNSYYYKNGEFKLYPTKPHDYFIWNSEKEEWELNIDLYDFYINDLKISAIQKRNGLLLNSDWTELPSALQRLGEAKVAEWQTYRQTLRDITNQEGYPENITWPEQPTN